MNASPTEMTHNNRPRLVHITTVPQTLGFFRGHVGYLQRIGFDVHAVSSPGEKLSRFAEEQQVPVFGISMTRSITPPADAAALFRLARVIHSLEPDIVHCHTPKAGLLGTVAARLVRVPVVFLSVFGLPQLTRTGFARFALDASTRLACAMADRVWCDSFSVRDLVVRTGLCAERVVFVLGKGSVSGVDATGVFSTEVHGLASRSAVRREHLIPEDAQVAGFVGRVVKDKGMHDLALAWRALREEYPLLHLLLVGPLEDTDPLLPEDERAFRDDPRVHLVGERADVPAQMAAMDLFVMPSYREGFGVTNIEAAAMGLPVVSTCIPGCVDSVVHGATGTLVTAGDWQGLLAAIRSYLDNETLRRTHGANGRRRVLSNFAPADIWEALAREYILCLQAKKRPLPTGLLASG